MTEAKYKFQIFLSNTAKNNHADCRDELQTLTTEAFGDAKQANIGQLIDAKLRCHIKKLNIEAEFEDAVYEQIFKRLRKEQKLDCLDAPTELMFITVHLQALTQILRRLNQLASVAKSTIEPD